MIAHLGLWMLMLLLIFVGCSDKGTEPPKELETHVAIQIDVPRGSDIGRFGRLTDELTARHIPATLFVHGYVAMSQHGWIHMLFMKGFEIALLGGDFSDLDTISYEEQHRRLQTAMTSVKGCTVCGTSQPVVGFRPGGSGQNQDTYRILDELEVEYNSGFRVGQIYWEGHKQDKASYRIPDHRFVALPISTVPYEGRTVPLSDLVCAEEYGLTGNEWRQMLEAALDRAIRNGDPLVVVFCGECTGNEAVEGYWDAFVGFLDEAQRRSVTFMTSKDLVVYYLLS